MSRLTFSFKLCFLAAFITSKSVVFAGDLDKSFKYLNSGDYANALKYLREFQADEPDNAAVNYGLAKFYFSKDNKLYNIDSANLYIKKAAAKIPFKPDDKQTKKFLTLGVRDYTIQTLQQDINHDAYTLTEQQNTLESYQYFVDNFTDKGLLGRAVNTRNQLAFIRARSKNDPKMLDEFIKKYPDADEAKEAKDLYEKLLYEQTTADQTYESYKKYFDTYPNGAYVKEAQKNYNDKLLEFYNKKHELSAYLDFEKKYKNHPAFNAVEDSIYKIATYAGTIDAFKNFIQNYRQNRNWRDAWDQLYILSTAEATEELYRKFLDQYPDYPNKDKIYTDIETSKIELKRFSRNDKWGYVAASSTDTIVPVFIIPKQYAEAFEFKDGYAAVRIDACSSKCFYFYIDKNNQQVFPLEVNYAGDFEKGYAVVGTGNCDNAAQCKYGLIDKRGHFVIAPEYEEVNELTEDMYLVAKDGKYGFLNRSGDVAITLKYSDAQPFSEGKAAVAIDHNWFFIDKTGKQVFINRFQDVSSFKDGYCAVSTDGENWGYIDGTGNFMIQPIYEAAEDFENGFGIVSKKEKDPKNKALSISQRYKIDKTGKVIEKLTAPKEQKKVMKKMGRR